MGQQERNSSSFSLQVSFQKREAEITDQAICKVYNKKETVRDGETSN